MNLELFWLILTKQWKIVIGCVIVLTLGAYIGSKLMTPIYQSVALLQVSVHSTSNQADINGLLASDQLVQTEAQLAVSDPVLREVASHYPGMRIDQLVKKVTATTRLNTQLFEIDVQDPNPKLAAVIANDVATTLIKQQALITQQDNDRSQQQIQQELNSTKQAIDSTTNQITSVTNQIKQNQNDPLQAPATAAQTKLAVLQTQLTNLQTHYSQWQTILAQLELTQAQNDNFLRIVQNAQPAITAIRPVVLLNTAGGLLTGLLLGLLLAVILAQLDTRIRTADALTQIVEWPILATVWRAKASKEGKEELLNPAEHSSNVESYRILRTNIGFSVLDKPLRSILVTSAVPQEGKSTTAANLAIFMAKSGKNTLLIDADLRRPTIHEKFHLSGEELGLSNAVVAFAQLQTVTATTPVHEINTLSTPVINLNPYMHTVDIPNLRIMPSGPLPPNPPELLDSKIMEQLFTLVTSSGAEMIIIDTPPLIGLSDTSILAPKVDGAIVVVDITQANKKNLKQVKALMTQSGSRVLGCVINKQYQNRKDTAYSYYYHEEKLHGREKNRKNAASPVIPIQPIPNSPLDRKIRTN